MAPDQCVRVFGFPGWLRRLGALMLAGGLLVSPAAHSESSDDDADAAPWSSATLKGLELRNIGPALMSGRIAHIEILPDDPATWYVAVGSGGVWKTENAGTTWTPIFDKESSYSVGTLAIDPGNPDSVWVGTGENVGGRHVGFGDGVYHSTNGGASWTKRGLSETGHISRIIVHPKDPDTVWVAAQGPLWSQGGERGVYKTTDGGETWQQVLSKGPWTGATDLLIDPTDPNRLYAATWQRHRTVATFIGGGPESAIYRSEDGGDTWVQLTEGLPKNVNVGKIGLALSPQQPSVVYAAIELDNRTGGVWRSTNRGGSWEKRSDKVSGGTGPHYYQELYASPHRFDRLYLMNNTTQVSEDGGTTWRALNNELKHVDDHAIAFRPDDPDYLMVGSDGGLYESYDNEEELALHQQPARYPVLQSGGRRRGAVLSGLWRHPGQQLSGRPVAHRQPPRHPQFRLVHHAVCRRSSVCGRTGQSGHHVRRMAGRESGARGSHHRRIRAHSAPARAGRPGGTVQLGRADSRQRAQPATRLFRLATAVALRRSRRQLARAVG